MRNSTYSFDKNLFIMINLNNIKLKTYKNGKLNNHIIDIPKVFQKEKIKVV